ncbi:MAG: GNAT family N-acetyltransferase [Clostridia bacterium]|nr:GNAT family N-acetyltransferase [Clostridia bacterium]
MEPIEYTIAQRSDQAALIDFANYVFSQSSEPHDFKLLLPKVYGDHVCAAEAATHYIARRAGAIRALVAMLPLEMRILDSRLSLGFVGTVSVHPYERGQGHMKRLMGDMLSDARRRGLDMLILGGQRQRYGYFGFERAGVGLQYTVTATNLRHCLGEADVSDISFSPLTADRPDELAFVRRLCRARSAYVERPESRLLDILRSWNSECLLIRKGGERIGYVSGAIIEIGLTDESLLPLVLRALFAAKGLEEAELSVAPYETERIRALRPLCESYSLQPLEMVNVLNWPSVLTALLRLKADYTRLEDGRVTLDVDGGGYALQVQGGQPSVTRFDGVPDLSLHHLKAMQLLFGLESAVCAHPFRNWLPLPFFMSAADGF